MAHKRLIALMLTTMLTTAPLTGCGAEKTDEEIGYEDEIRQILEYEANTNLSQENVKKRVSRLNINLAMKNFILLL